MLVFGIAIAISCLIAAVISSVTCAADIEKKAEEHSSEAARTISTVIDERGGLENVIGSTDGNALSIQKTLEFIAYGYDLEYLYLFTFDEENSDYHYIAAVSSNDELTEWMAENRGVGSVVKVSDVSECVVEASHGKVPSNILREDNEFGKIIGWVYPLDLEFEGRRVMIGAEYLTADIYHDIVERAIIIIVPTTVILIIAGAVLLLITRFKIVVPITSISDHMRRFTENYGGENEKIRTVRNDEIGDIALAFNTMSDDIHRLIADNTALNEVRLQTQIQLDIARRIQSGIVPEKLDVRKPDYNVCAFARAARSVGGDFYDSFMTDDSRVCIVIGDVSGKGITAALFMTMTKTIIKEMLRLGISPAEALNRANDEMCESNPEGLFATVFAAELDLNTGVLTYANAGHNPPVLLKEKPEFLKTEIGIALGVFEDAGIVSESATLKKGEGILLYTDGVTEAVDKSESFYGTERLLNACADCADSEAVVSKVSGSVLDFYDGAPQFDDLTMISLFCEKSAETVLELKPELSEFSKLKAAVEGLAADSPKYKQIVLACDEVFANICSYSNAKNVNIVFARDGAFTISFIDDGEPFDPLGEREEKDFDDFDEGGMGISLVKQIADELTYRRGNDKNILKLRIKEK